MPSVILTRGFIAQVDERDFPLVAEFKWFASSERLENGLIYALRTVAKSSVYMHRFIAQCPVGMIVDHINGDGLDNRRSNLRICCDKKNSRNRRPVAGSGFKGVYPDGRKWRARIWPDGGDEKSLHLGMFAEKEDAARAYDRAAIEHYGPFAWTNFPREEYEEAAEAVSMSADDPPF